MDLQLPGVSGFDVLEWLRDKPRLQDIRVLVFTNSSNPDDAKRAYSLGARAYRQKPADFRRPRRRDRGDLPIQQVALTELRERVGLVLQDVFLFSRDVGYNIWLGSEEITSDEVRAAADRIGAAPFIDRLPKAYDQPLGERGSTLSVGERQLVSFARALAFDPRILILDEATSSVDSEIEAHIERATDELMKGRTSLVIAHRLSTVQGADRILVFHHGEMREEGTHQELLGQEGLYARLYELQFAASSVA